MSRIQEVDTVKFDADWTAFVNRSGPEDVLYGVNELAKEFRRELVAGSPSGPAANRYRRNRRALKGARGRGYGPIKKAWSRRQTKSLDKPAVVINQAFYAPLVEFGSDSHAIRPKLRSVLSAGPTGPAFGTSVRHPGSRPRPFARPVLNRADAITRRTLERILPRRGRP